MKAFRLLATGAMRRDKAALTLMDVEVPEPGPDELRLKVTACGVCHTELDEIEGRASPPKLPVTPGHEIIGLVDKVGRDVSGFGVGDRLGMGWIHSSSGDPTENLSERFVATGRDVDGGYAEFVIANARYVFPVPDSLDDVEAAPLLCAGSVGYRSLMLSNLGNGQRLGLTGFGGSAHIVLQLSRYLYPNCSVYVFARDPAQQRLAKSLGADWVGGIDEPPPQLLDAVIDTTPAWRPVLASLEKLRPGGRLVINAISKEQQDKGTLLDLDYTLHLWREKEIKTVANVTAHDITRCLEIAAAISLRPVVEPYSFEDANRALADLKLGPVRGAKVLRFNK